MPPENEQRSWDDKHWTKQGESTKQDVISAAVLPDEICPSQSRPADEAKDLVAATAIEEHLSQASHAVVGRHREVWDKDLISPLIEISDHRVRVAEH
jgi:hypothetical protein